MLLYTWQETAWMIVAAIAVDWLVGDPRWPTHPVVLIGRLIARLEAALRRGEPAASAEAGRVRARVRLSGVALTVLTVGAAFSVLLGVVLVCRWIHPWLGYAANVWFISTTIAVKGLKDAAMQVFRPLAEGDLPNARKYVGYIVGRDTTKLDEPEIVRATVETVAENTVDAFVSPVVFALLGGAPLAMLYRAANTLDSMVGYRNDKYRYFGWASARFDDVLNYVPARLTGLFIVVVCCFGRGLSAVRAAKSIVAFASLHPSPNSGIPESAVAGAIGIELGGLNRYGDVVSDRARMGWPLRAKGRGDIVLATRICYGVSYLVAGGLLCAIAIAAAAAG
ncbi:adenosylcobinamide-phosphate synthase CbiB [Paenibacillus flagellatus]|uniref:Cobalamin biosynthesis protein CobD n=1 Tax=Paenibacillus flagellatus TaxID=2211139 RepID=A0A2V5L3T7_9BACL|nr:adenosylcobinamide-phosphate synthase CbiB [Paenibacillus flagellatus]PYI57506.1 cobalamin biosynthesis protein CobD [Paenibacillus flagellatus]